MFACMYFMCTTCMPGDHGGQNRALCTPGPGIIGGYEPQVGDGNRTGFLCESTKCSITELSPATHKYILVLYLIAKGC